MMSIKQWKTLQGTEETVRVGESYDSLYLSIFNCLCSTKNSTFKAFVEQVEQNISSGSGAYNGFSPKMIMMTVVIEYKNMKAPGVWDKLDPSQIQLTVQIILTTKNTQRPC